MALDGKVLGDLMLSAIDQAVAGHPKASPEQRKAIWEAIGDAIVSHVVANGVVTIPLGVPVQVVVPAGTGATTAPAIGGIT